MSEHKKPHSDAPEGAEQRVVSPRARKEEEILATWTEKKIFQKSVDKAAPKGDFVFYDGPPFATGLPHYGHILPSTMKDMVPRYKTMRGYRVRRRWGWDCHGLPVENLVEKELGLKTKKDIIDYGIEKFNAAARSSVMKYADEWRTIIPRLGRFVDMENDYETMSCTYTESVWWAFKSLHDKGLIYEGFKSMHLCPRCETTLSNFEVNQGYKDITDISVYVKFRIKDAGSTEPTFALAWTTTPWTLPGNVALAIHPDLDYVYASSEGETYIVAKEKAVALFKDKQYTVTKEVKGSELVGQSYEPVFTYYSDASSAAGAALKHRDNAWKIYAADYVTLEKGSGIVHIAPAFGEEDLLLAQRVSLPIVHHVSTNGAFTKDVKDFAGMFVKEKSTPENKDAHQKADIEIIKNLANRPTGSLLFAKEKIIHSYPHCWRCETPLLNYASSSWFVKVTALKDKLVAQNKTVGWVPEEVGEGRFGNWLLGARDWAISRSRFWGAPLPVWKTEDGHEMVVMGSIADLKKHTKARNTYYIIRHGEAENNARNIVNADSSKPFKLTKNGREQAVLAAKELTFKLKGKNPDYIITSPFLRTKETAEIVAASFSGGPKPIADARIRELGAGHLDGKPLAEFIEYFGGYQHRFTKAPEGGENYADIKKRMGDFLYDIESKYEGKTIVIITHDTPAFLLTAAAHGLDREQSLELRGISAHFMGNAEVKHLDFVPLPHNHEYELDLHRPFIDTVQLTSASGKKLTRVPDVFDCWFESGSMPYAEAHYPFSEEGIFKPRVQGFKGLFSRGKGYPADFIAEGLDQTRGWFYSMLVLGVALFGKTPYKNVIVNGLILAEDGQKMSKSKKNYPDPMLIVDKYGVDALRYYLMASPAVKAQDLCFSEKGVDEVAKKHIGRLDNVLSFYEMYAENKPSQRSVPASAHVLDRWILARLRQVIRETTTALDAYELDRAVRPFADFIDDLSTWYLRRSRDRFKSEDASVRAEAVETLGYVLEETSKLIAPVMPFFAEDIYGRVGSVSATRPESVHLAEWPHVAAATSTDLDVMKTMTDVRKLVTLGLEARMQAKVQVRQPLRSLKVKAAAALAPEFVELMREELNVKNVEFVADLEADVLLDTTIDDELREEGAVRDIMRSLQDLRKKLGLVVSDMVKLTVETDEKGAAIVTKNKDAVSKVAGIQQIAFAETGEQSEAIVIDGVSYKFKIEKVGL